MYKHLFKFAVTTLTILTANLLTTFITDKLIGYKWQMSPVNFTLVAMGIITVIFYPLFTHLEDFLNHFSKRFVKAGHSLAGKYLGLILMYGAGLFILLYFYAKMWYNINVFKMLLNGSLF